MKTSEILALIGAGYTKADIDAMEQGENGKPEEETPKKETEVKPEPVNESKPEPNANAELLDAIRGLTALVQKNNVRDKAQPVEAVTPDVKKDVDDLLLNLYNN